MPDSIIDYSRLGWNIKCLREANNETLDDLVAAIGINSSGTLSGYESGTKKPSRDTLVNIAKHFFVTEDELVFGEFSYLSSLRMTDFPIADGKAVVSLIETLLPCITSECAMECWFFRIGYMLHRELLRQLSYGVPLNHELLQRCLQCYDIANHKGIVEAAANRLWWLVFEGIMIRGITPYLVNNITHLKLEQLDLGEYIKEHYLWKVNDKDDEDAQIIEEARTDYIREVAPEYARLLKILKHSQDYSDLADYYTALRYLYGIVDNNLTYELNSVVGKQMLTSLEVFGNQYVDRLFDEAEDSFLAILSQ